LSAILGYIYSTKTVLIAPSTPAKWIFLGAVAVPPGLSDSIYLQAKASAASGSLDIDCIALIALDDPIVGQALEVGGEPTAAGAVDAANIVVNHQLDYAREPTVYKNNAARPLPYTGDPVFLIAAGDTSIALALLATRGAAWVPTNDAGTPYSSTFTVTQAIGYLIPE
jgi:hypothetical protein